MAYSTEELQRAHQHSSNHRSSIESGNLCGCFHCVCTFRPAEITKWTDGENTALCPYCGIDAVVSSHDVQDISTDFLNAMREYWF
ncbi:MAG: hypothetical protein K8F91_07250 [Candidatus Obscuribacterales bacterium]|nr:hypothetical protein [Candidatus Obscuribacterales bacterium]